MPPPDASRKKALSGALVTSGKPLAYDVYSDCCPTRHALDRLADKWVVLILGLLARGPHRFNQLRREIEGVSQKVLSQTLKRLERDGLVARQAFPTVPVTVEYSITPLGLTLSDTAEALRRWAEGHMDQVLAAQAAYDAQNGTLAGPQASRATT